jgi:quinol monooxygenase YgiN
VTRIALFVKCQPKADCRAQVLAMLEESAQSAAKRPGTLLFAIHVPSGDPDAFWVYELYENSEAQIAHSRGETATRLRTDIKDLLAEPLQVIKTESHLAVGLLSG